MEIILPPEPPIQSLLDHIFDDYGSFDEFCEFTEDGDPVDIEDCVKCHKESYYDEGNPVYACDNFKKIYLFRYLATQFAQSDFLIKENVLHYIEEKVNLSAVSLGGGPAPEALALMNGLSSCNKEYTLSFRNIDCEDSWEAIYEDLTHHFGERIKNIKLHTDFRVSDVTGYVSDRQYDIVFVSWILSEMNEQDRPQAVELVRDLVSPSGFILLTDRLEEALIEDISNIISKTDGVNLQKQDVLVRHYCGVSFPDEIAELFKVRLNSYAAYWILKTRSDDF